AHAGATGAVEEAGGHPSHPHPEAGGGGGEVAGQAGDGGGGEAAEEGLKLAGGDAGPGGAGGGARDLEQVDRPLAEHLAQAGRGHQRLAVDVVGVVGEDPVVPVDVAHVVAG